MASQKRGVGVPPKANTGAVLASLGCCQARNATARYASQRAEYDAPK